MRDRYIAPAIMLTAGAITSVLNIVNEVDFLEGMKRLLLVLILFYVIGKIATKIIKKVTSFEIKSSDEEDIEEQALTDEGAVVEGTKESKEQ
jgi:hypothetical protein